ncbi:MAG: bifunctional diaminohydroxyphosphoribosylaminopyrimidine deaminase/5-amino-6-(5-phosphoribosylamino)uracil reductase RibD, partial [Leptolyngbyaceae cyanobacterium CAN_BIN12]|nr:bifunctional diaminohydroxyphosphoribosylaminopyrimidine deaminase/5-amino-6-(5-phosphoribosylamino)uracil reductase RibD [Leptolyngbyaceae cyanobacterium CAN_BIN12]
NPQVAGTGRDRLKQAGIEVSIGIEESACQTLNEAFVHRILHHRPFGILKYAMTLDGKIAAVTRHSAWVTSEAARGEVHQLRATCDAVIVGGNTIRADDPLLTSRQPGQTPVRVIMSRTLDLPNSANVWNTSVASTLVFTQVGVQPAFQTELKQRGEEVVELEPLTPNTVMVNLYDRGFLTVLWECGGTLAARAIAEGAVQKVLAFIAPKIIGGVTAPSPVGDLGLKKMTEALTLEKVSWRAIGSDLLIEGYLPENKIRLSLR